MRHIAIHEGVGKLCSVLNRISGIVLMFLVVLLTVNILGRAINYPILGTVEIIRYGFAILVCTTVAYTAFEDAHIAIDLFVNHYPPMVKAVVETISQLLGIVIFSTLAWRLFVDAVEAYTLKEASSTLGLPTYLFQFCLAFGWGLLVLVIVSKLVKRVGVR